MFVDEVDIEIAAGHGGRGAMSFRREKFIPRGGPDGGDGGNGGSVYLVASPHVNTLVNYRFHPKHAARRGGHGSGANRTGAAGADIELDVPIGTLVYAKRVIDEAQAAEFGDEPEDFEIVADRSEAGQRALIARGGKGGLGNLNFKSSTNRAPRRFTRGEQGEKKQLELELRVLADVGLLGMPNAGKSTLIRAVSSARPKVADYPFTTLQPNLGVVRVDMNRSLVMADIPGLIEGAAEGAGLGHQFLRHLQRTGLLLHLVDMAPFDAGVDPAAEVRAITAELKKYDPGLAKKTRWLVFNKADLLGAKEARTRAQALAKRLRWTKPWYVVSAIKSEGTRELSFAIMDFLEKTRERKK